MGATRVVFRDYRRSDSESIWRLDQTCSPHGIAYSRSELRPLLFRRAVERMQLATAVTNRSRSISPSAWATGRSPGCARYYGPGLDAWKMQKALDGAAP